MGQASYSCSSNVYPYHDQTVLYCAPYEMYIWLRMMMSNIQSRNHHGNKGNDQQYNEEALKC